MFNIITYFSKKNNIDDNLLIRIPSASRNGNNTYFINKISNRKYGDIDIENEPSPSYLQRFIIYIYSFRIFKYMKHKSINSRFKNREEYYINKYINSDIL
jgi:hypothetical protein